MTPNVVLFSLLLATPVSGTPSPKTNASNDVTVIPAQGNTWYAQADEATERRILTAGIDSWTDADKTLRTYFFAPRSGTVDVAVRARVSEGPAILEVKLGEVTKQVSLASTKFRVHSVGGFTVGGRGYHALEIRGLRKTGVEIADITAIHLAGMTGLHFVKDTFYWSRRGPSVHLKYQVPKTAREILYFYSEVHVPQGRDVLGSYFMAGGFAEGYFGIQVNSPEERRILFSVWSPFKTDDPTKVPADQRIELVKKGPDVHTGKFGNEGSGGQSYRKYMWKAGVNYRFLVKAAPTGKGQTDYTAWFFAPELGSWQLIAGFRRPKTHTHLKRLHSFLENFLTQTGNQSRMAHYGNQWIYDTQGRWHALTKAVFTGDATARKKNRLDFDGGATGKHFYLRNCGFFTAKTALDSEFERKPEAEPPKIDFANLP